MNTECRRVVRLRRINFNIDGAKRRRFFDIQYAIFILAVLGFFTRSSGSMTLDQLASFLSPGMAAEAPGLLTQHSNCGKLIHYSERHSRRQVFLGPKGGRNE